MRKKYQERVHYTLFIITTHCADYTDFFSEDYEFHEFYEFC